MAYEDLFNQYLANRFPGAAQPEPTYEANVKPVTQTITTDPSTGEQTMTVKGRPEDLTAGNPNTPTVLPPAAPEQPKFNFGAQPTPVTEAPAMPQAPTPAPMVQPQVQQPTNLVPPASQPVAPVPPAPAIQPPAPAIQPPAPAMQPPAPAMQPPAPAPVAPVSPMIAGNVSSDVGLTPTEQAVKQMPVPNQAPAPQPVAQPPAPQPTMMPKVIPGQHGMNLVSWQDQPEKIASIANDTRPESEGGPTVGEKQLANRLLGEYYQNQSKQTAETKRGEQMIAKNDEKGIARVLTSKEPEGSYLKAYLYNRLGLTQLANQEQMLLGAGSTLQRVTLPDGTQSIVRLRGDNVASYGVDTKTGEALTPDQLALASASYAKGAETGAAMYKTRDGHTISVTRVPGRVEPIFYDNTEKKILENAPLGMTPLGQKDSIIESGMTAKKQVETAARKENNRAGGTLYTEQQIQQLGNNAFRSLTGYDYNSREHGVVSPQEEAVQNAPGTVASVQQGLSAGGRAVAGQGEFTDPSIRVISAQRPTPQQQSMWDESVAAGRPGRTAQGNPIAKPGTSLHETDNARDIDASRLTKAGRQELYEKGWYQPIPQQDPNHWERIGAAPAREAPTEKTGVQKNIESTAQAIANYSGKPLTAGGAQGSYNQAVMARVREINPDYNETKYKAAQEVRSQYTKVNPASAGGQLQAVNRAIPHLDQFKEATRALENGDLPLVNKITNLYGKNVGSDKVAAAKAIQNLVATEVQKAVAGGLGGVEERKDLSSQLSTNMNPQQINAVIDAYQNLMAAQALGLKQNWTSNGLPAAEFNDKLVPKAREVLVDHERKENNKRSKW